MSTEPQGTIHFCDMPAGMSFCHELLHRFLSFFWWFEQKTVLNLSIYITTFVTCSAIWGLLDEDDDLRASHDLLNTERIS